MNTLIPSVLSLNRSDQAINEILHAQMAGESLLLVPSCPGSGKSHTVEHVAAHICGIQRRRCMVVTRTNAQSVELAGRIATRFSKVQVDLFIKKQIPVPSAYRALPNFRVVHDSGSLRPNAVAVANASKWSESNIGPGSYDSMLIDESYQITYALYAQFARLAPQQILVGDPGQIEPVVTVPIERWACEPFGPHSPAPIALERMHPAVRKVHLDITWRLMPDTERVLQAFYPNFPFQAAARPGDRELLLQIPGITPLDDVLNHAASGASLLQLELPRKDTGPLDPELAQAIVDLIVRMVRVRQAHVRDGVRVTRLTPAMIGVVCAHRNQVTVVRSKLPTAFSEVLVDTADRVQGLQREVVIFHHPLSGRMEPTEFHMNPGRTCVMMSRHRVACISVTRTGIRERLYGYAFQGDRVPGSLEDRELMGWSALAEVQATLERMGRVHHLP